MQLATAQEKAARNEEAAKNAAVLQARVTTLEDERRRYGLVMLHRFVLQRELFMLAVRTMRHDQVSVVCRLAETVREVVLSTPTSDAGTPNMTASYHADLDAVMKYLRSMQQERLDLLSQKGVVEAKAASAGRAAEVAESRVKALVNSMACSTWTAPVIDWLKQLVKHCIRCYYVRNRKVNLRHVTRQG